MTRTLESKLGWPGPLTAHLESELRAHFGEAWISCYEALIPRMANDEKDRHLLAAAADGRASRVLTLHLRHFRPEHLKPWGIRALHPQSFLSELFREEEMLLRCKKLEEQAANRGRSFRQVLTILSATVPEFVSLVSNKHSDNEV